MKRLINIILVLLVLFTCLGCNNKEDKDKSVDKKDDSSKTIKTVESVLISFEKLNNYDGNITINQFQSEVSHADDKNSVNGILEQDKYKISLNPIKNEGKFFRATSMYNILEDRISFIGEREDINLSYDNLLIDYIKDDSPYQFYLKDNKISKLKSSPSFYCEGCRGSYYGKTHNGTQAYIIDSFTEDDIESGSARNDIDEYKTYFHWIKTYIKEINELKVYKSDMSDYKEDYSRLIINTETIDSNQTIRISKDIKKISEYEKDELLAYISHQNFGVWDLSEVYVEIKLDKEGYPVSYENMVKVKHIANGMIVPLYTKTIFKRN